MHMIWLITDSFWAWGVIHAYPIFMHFPHIFQLENATKYGLPCQITLAVHNGLVGNNYGLIKLHPMVMYMRTSESQLCFHLIIPSAPNTFEANKCSSC